jgi:hypothetical protein
VMVESPKIVLLSRGIYRIIGEKDQGAGKGTGTGKGTGIGNIGIPLGINRKEERIVQDLVVDLATAIPQGAATKPGTSKSSKARIGKELVSSLKEIRATLMILTLEGMIAS